MELPLQINRIDVDVGGVTVSKNLTYGKLSASGGRLFQSVMVRGRKLNMYASVEVLIWENLSG
jgi:hypothetical protein